MRDELCVAVMARRNAVSCRNREDHSDAHRAIDSALSVDDQDWLGMLCDRDGSFIFRYRDFSVCLRYCDTLIPHWDLQAEGCDVVRREIAYDLRQSLVNLLAHLDVVAMRCTTGGTG